MIVASPFPTFLMQLKAARTGDDLVIAVGLTVEAAYWSLAGDALLRLVAVDAMSLSTDRDQVVNGLAGLANVSSALFGDAPARDGRVIADEHGITYYVQRPTSAILFVAKMRHLLYVDRRKMVD